MRSIYMSSDGVCCYFCGEFFLQFLLTSMYQLVISKYFFRNKQKIYNYFPF
jgi:hypothetical protein